MATAQADVPGDWLQIAVARAGDGSLVGDCALAPQSHEARTVEIGFFIAPEHQGRGYAREAVSLLLHYLFGQLGKHRVTASCDSRNAPSVRVLETADAPGFLQEVISEVGILATLNNLCGPIEPAFDVQQFLGGLAIHHSSTASRRMSSANAAETLDTYSHLWPDSDDRTREAVDLVLAGFLADSLRTSGTG
jgi:GNAT superfamily N-acetyltransferase